MPRANPEQFADATRWAVALADHPIRGSHGRWIARVVGVHSDDRHIWVQVARDAGAPPATVVLCLSPRATIAHAVTALERCTFEASQYPVLVNVMRML